jgi:hypothetical protein
MFGPETNEVGNSAYYKARCCYGNPLESGNLEDVIMMDIIKICYEGGRWMALAQDRFQWWALVLTVLNLRVLLPEMYLIGL